jgi:hypothetical protein
MPAAGTQQRREMATVIERSLSARDAGRRADSGRRRLVRREGSHCAALFFLSALCALSRCPIAAPWQREKLI